MKKYFAIILVPLLLLCNKSENSKEDLDSISLNAGLLLQRSGRLIIAGTAVKGILKNAKVVVNPLNPDGSCNSTSILAQETTDDSGNYSLSYKKTGSIVCLTVSASSSGKTTLFDENTNADVSVPSTSTFKLVSILPESRITENSRQNTMISPFSKLLARRLQYLATQAGTGANMTALHKRASKEIVIRFGLQSGLSAASSRSIRPRAANMSLSDASYPELDDITLELENPESPLTAKFISILVGFSLLANKYKKGTTLSVDDIDAMIEAFAIDFEDGFFDGKGIDGKAITVGSGTNQITFPSSPLTNLLQPAIIYYFQAGGKLTVGRPTASTATFTTSQITSQVAFIDNAIIGLLVGGAGVLTPSNVTTTSLTMSWTAAVDDVTPQANLNYLLYYSTSSSFDSIAQVEAGTPVGAYAPNITAVNVSGLTLNTIYYFNLIVKDEAGNKAVYVKTKGVTDTTVPIVGGSGILTSTKVVANPALTVTVNWTAATDNLSLPANLSYLLYYSTSSSFDTVAQVEAGTAVGSYATSITSSIATGLLVNTIYYFNVIVKDEAGNKSIYTKINVSAPIAASTTASRVYGQLGVFTTNTANNGGVSANSLGGPSGAAVDSSNNVYIVDYSNHRMLYYPAGTTTATRVYGQGGVFTANTANNGGVSANSLSNPQRAVLDSSGNLYVSDQANNRVLYYAVGSTTATRVYGQGGVFTTNTVNNGGVSANSLNCPFGLTLDAAGNLYVADDCNHRVLYYPAGTTTATRVYGQGGIFTTNTANNGGISANSLLSPEGVVVDSSNNVYIADRANNRVLYYPSGTTTATRVYGQGGSFTTNTANNGGISANSFSAPIDVTLIAGNLYVADNANCRILYFASGVTTATTVYGQNGSFTVGTANTGGISANSLNNVDGIVADTTGNLYITDFSNARVLYYKP